MSLFFYIIWGAFSVVWYMVYILLMNWPFNQCIMFFISCNSFFSSISITTSVLFWLLFVWNIFLKNPFIFNLFMSLVSLLWQHIVGSILPNSLFWLESLILSSHLHIIVSCTSALILSRAHRFGFCESVIA